MSFYFYGRYIHTKNDPKQVENDMYDVPIFQVLITFMITKTEKAIFESFFSYFALTSEQRCHYARMKLVEEPYHWINDNYKFCRCWSRLQNFLYTRYAPHLLYADCKESNVEQEPDNRSITDICTELRKALERCNKSGCKHWQRAKIRTKSCSRARTKSCSWARSEPTVVNEPEPEIEEPLVETSTDLPVEFAIELVPSSPATVRVLLPMRSSDVYDLLQILLEATGPQEFRFLMVQSTINPVFSEKDLPRYVAWINTETSRLN